MESECGVPFFFVIDLLEVVDRRAKIVATELSDEQSTSQPSGSVPPWFIRAHLAIWQVI
jgi:hypothetical protein